MGAKIRDAKQSGAERRPKGRANSETEVSRIAGLLDRCLGDDEMRDVAAAALVALGKEASQRLRPMLAAATWATLERVIEPVRGKAGRDALQSPVVPGEERVRQDWARLLERWEACVAETSDEKGDYVEQEHDWECPYFNVDQFAEDLDCIAEDIEPLIPLVIVYRLESDFSFLEWLEDAALEVSSGLPEWMENLGGTGLAGAAITRCVLQWERLSGRQAGERAEGGAAFAFVDRLRQAEDGASRWGFSHGTVANFVADLPAEEQRGILAGLAEHRHESHWAEVLANPRSGWFLLLEQLLARFDPGQHASLLRRSVSRDWKLALPLLEEAVQSADGSDWEETIATAVPAPASTRDGPPWDPKSSLLITRKAREWLPDVESKMVGRFLWLWEDLLRQAGRAADAAVLSIQHQVWEGWGDWECVLRAFGRAATVCNISTLFEEWRDLVTERSRQEPGFRFRPAAKDVGWVPLLVDAARLGESGATDFQVALRGWLALACGSAEAFRSARPWLEVLTADLDADLNLAHSAPFLHRALGALMKDCALEKSRQAWLRRFGAAGLRDEIMTAWRTAPAQLLLDPASAASSRYEDHARWLGVIHDLEPAFYRHTIRSWRLAHGRRRNLWQAIRLLGLPLDD